MFLARVARVGVRINRALGPVDGFDQDESACKCNERGIILSSLFAAKGDALEALELSDGLLNPATGFVEDPGEESGSALGRRAVRNDRADAALACCLPVGLGIIPFVSQDGARGDVRTDVEQDLELTAVTGLAPGHMDCQRVTIKVSLHVDLGRETAAGATQSLALLPPLAPAAETWARTTVLSNI